ncbi:hypothetical protein [Cetobacterium sp.]|uniref:hypothetical protein n=1 Tax=Cetobacterium sp. TaxID=2071632 RepID=UPI003F396237
MPNNKLETLNFEIGKYGPKCETLKDYETSIFKKIYEEAFESLNEILENEGQLENNNIISFIGERGSGKTSCMLSFEKILIEALKEKSEILKDKNISEYHFETLDMIDPSFFTSTSNVLEIIIATLFKEFKESSNKSNNIEEQRNILLQFKKVYQTISIIENKYEFDGENYNKLLDLSASITLKKDINNLIKSYLDFVSKKEKKSKLIIKIDDIDLNIKHSYEMVEQIRKYLIQENVIVLIAVKLEQLEQIIKVNYKDDFKKTETGLDYEKMSYRYLEKLIPQNRRMYLLDLEKELKKINIKLFDEVGVLEKELRQLLYNKIRILFTDYKVKNNPILPKNLRELINFMNIFNKLKDIKDNSSEKNELFKENVLKFDNYFFNAWIEDNLTKDNREIIKELHAKAVGEKNKYIVTKILEKLNQSFEESNKKLENVNKYRFISTNISLGDVLENLDNLKKSVVDNESENFITSIKILYSRYIYEYYLDYKEDDRLNSSEYTDYEILIGGEIVVSKNILYAPEAFENISLNIFYTELKKLFNEYDTILNRIENEGTLEEDKFTELKLTLEKIEFLSFITYFFKDINAQDKRIGGNLTAHKKLGKAKDEAFYNGIYDLSNKNIESVEFDLFSPLFFSLSEYRLLNRYIYSNMNLFNFINNINQKIGENSKLKKINPNFFKGIYFRNIEIIEKTFKKLTPFSSSEKFEVIRKTFEGLGKLKINTDIIGIDNTKKYQELLNYLNKSETRTYFNNIIFTQISKENQEIIKTRDEVYNYIKITRRAMKNWKNDILEKAKNEKLKSQLKEFLDKDISSNKLELRDNIEVFFKKLLGELND